MTSLLQVRALKVGDTVVSFHLEPQQLCEIIGPNGSGKSYLARLLGGKVFNQENITRNVALNDISYTDFSADTSGFQYDKSYYQERYQNGARGESLKVIDFLQRQQVDPSVFDVAQLLPDYLLQRELIELSSGETRKVLIAKTLLKPAKIYILDNPFTGLDAASILALSVFLQEFRQYKATCLVVLDVKSHFKEAEYAQIIDLSPFLSRKNVVQASQLPPITDPKAGFSTAFQISNANILVGGKILLQDVNWTITKGEKWLLQGANGSGKTTLTSLFYADNPAAYGYDLKVFDKQRGSGESIWQIKSRIGLVSPEIQNFWPQTAKVIDVARSGLTGTQVLTRKATPDEVDHIQVLLTALGLSGFAHTPLGQLSTGEKKMAMIVRALATNPPVVILDEPFQGLDEEKTALVKALLASLATPERTFVQIAHEKSEILDCINRRAWIREKKLHIEKAEAS
jgi:molybdate transport system ATP-binding protein